MEPPGNPGRFRSLLFAVTAASGTSRWDEAEIVVQPLGAGERKVVWTGGSDARYVRSGHLVFALSSALFAIPFDLTRLETSGAPVPVIENVARAFLPEGNTASGNYDASLDGVLAYVPAAQDPVAQRTLVWVDRQGLEKPVPAEPGPYTQIRLSPEGRRVAIEVQDPDNTDVWIYDLERDAPTRFTSDPGRDSLPIWTPDGKRIVFASNREGDLNLYWKNADGSGGVERLTMRASLQGPHSFAPDGRLVFGDDTPEAATDLYLLSMDGDRRPEALVRTEFRDTHGNVSPDGRWLAYESDHTGWPEVYVRPFPNVGDGQWPITQGGGIAPQWGPNSRELFYQTSDGAMMVADNETDPVFRPGTPEQLFRGPYLWGSVGGQYAFDYSPDEQAFLMIKEDPAAGASSDQQRIVVVQHWHEELKRLVPID